VISWWFFKCKKWPSWNRRLVSC